MSSCQAIRNYSAILSFKTLIFIVYLFFFIDERFYTHKFIILKVNIGLFQGLSATPHARLALDGSPTMAPAFYSAATS